ncbi:conserved hypothetical protein [Ricinus communis]|uniref:Uncharacterized protein n=1 Tax=Ricinus communis TaxID=3988 RepID=B9S1K4_RICCO|nr:conserved hypothetical protein [Ricinus communis]
MPVGFKVVPDLDLNCFFSFHKTWSKFASGQIASTTELFHFKKCSIGGGVMQNFSEIGVGSLVHLFNALLMQHPVKVFGKMSSGRDSNICGAVAGLNPCLFPPSMSAYYLEVVGLALNKAVKLIHQNHSGFVLSITLADN